MSEFNLKSGNTTPFKMMGSSPAKETTDEGTKKYVVEKKQSSGGSSGGYKSTEFGKGGRSTDKGHKTTTLSKTNPTTESYRDKDESDKVSYRQTKTRKVRGLEAFLSKKKKKGDVVTKTKEISGKKYRRTLARKTKTSIKKGHDKETYVDSQKVDNTTGEKIKR